MNAEGPTNKSEGGIDTAAKLGLPGTGSSSPSAPIGDWKITFSGMEKKILSTVVALVLIMIAFGYLTNGIFFEPRNLSNLLRQTSINGILAVGMTWVILLGGVDLSVGSVTALVGVIIAIAQSSWGWGTTGFVSEIFLTFLLAIGSGILVGAFNAAWIAGLNIHSFVITFGMMVIARGLGLILSKGSTIALPRESSLIDLGAGYIGNQATAIILFTSAILYIAYTLWDERKGRSQKSRTPTWRVIAKIAGVSVVTIALYYVCSSYQGLPTPVLIFGFIALLGSWILARTRFGRYIYAVGGNTEAARLAGIPVKKVIFLVFASMGTLAGVAGTILTARLASAAPTAGANFELDAIASVVIGGTSLKGGKGSVYGSIIGALIISSLNNGLNLLNVSEFYQMPLKGAIVIMAVAIDSIVEKRKDI